MDTLLLLMALNLGAVTLDGVSTLYPRAYAWDGYEISWPERNPVTAAVIGKYPTWSSMVIPGCMEVAGGAIVGALLHRYGVRRWWVPQVALSGLHMGAAGVNLVIKIAR